MPQDELFESPPEPTEESSKAEKIASAVMEKQPKKQRKPRPPMTPERKAQLLQNLKVGRETSARNRKLKAEARRIVKSKHMDEVHDVIRKDVLSKKSTEDLEAEISRLKSKLSKTHSPPPVEEPVEAKAPSVIVADSNSIVEPAIITFSTRPKSIWS